MMYLLFLFMTLLRNTLYSHDFTWLREADLLDAAKISLAAALKSRGRFRLRC